MLLCADNIHGLNPLVIKAIQESDPGPIHDMARNCEAKGADLIDINPGHIPRSKLHRIEFLVKSVQEVTHKRLVIDSPNPGVLERAIEACKSPPILNAVSLEKDKLAIMPRLAAEGGCDLVVLLMDERSFTPGSEEEKIALALEIASKVEKNGLELDKLIFDPVAPNISWEDFHKRIASDLSTIRMLSTGSVFQTPVRTMLGLSNLRSGSRSRVPYELERCAMFMFAGAGLDILLADVFQEGFVSSYHTIQKWTVKS